MDDLPVRPPQGTPEIPRVIHQPEDEVPDMYIKNGRLTSKNPTVAKQRAEFKIQEIRVIFDLRPLQEAINPLVKAENISGIIKLLENSVMNIDNQEGRITVTMRSGNET